VKPKVEPVKPVEVVKSPAKKTGRVVVPKSAKQLGVTPTLRITTKNGTGNRPAGPKRPTSQKLTANETKYLAERRAALDEAAEPTPTERAAQAARERVAAKNAAAGVTPNAKGQASARAAQAARESAAAKVSAAQKAEILAKAEAKAARLAKIGAGAVRVAKVAGKVSGVATAADMAYEVATDPLGRKRAGRMMDWLKKHPNASGLDRMKAQAKNMAFRDPYLMDKYDGERPPTGNLKGSVRGRGTGGAMKKAVKAVQKPAKPAMPRSTKPAVKTPQKPAVGRLGASTHVVKHGDTLWGIARDNKTTVSAILGANPTIAERRKNGQTSIFSGTKVRIPKGK
jgi:LysM repeat protein